MTEHLDTQALLILAVDFAAGPAPQPGLTLAWQRDPMSGRPVAHWVAATTMPCVSAALVAA